jgi:hypothetical protein
MNREDLQSVKVDFTKLFFEVDHPGPGNHQGKAPIEAGIGIGGVRKELDALKLLITVRSIGDIFFRFEVAAVATITFKRNLVPDEFKDQALYKMCFGQCVGNIIEVIANNSGRLGLTPIIIEHKLLSDLFNSSVEKLNLANLKIPGAATISQPS